MHKIIKYEIGGSYDPSSIYQYLNNPNPYLTVPKLELPKIDPNKLNSITGATSLPKLSGINGAMSKLTSSGLVSPLTQTVGNISNIVAPKTASLTNSIGGIASNAISQINPTAGLANSVGDLAIGSIFGKDKSNPDDVGGQVVNQVANVASMFGPIGMAAGLGVKALNALGTTKVKGNTMDERTGQSSGFSGTISKNQADKNLSIFGNKGKQRRKVAEQQKRLNTISGILQKSDEDIEAANSFVVSDDKIDYTKGFRFGKEGIKLPNKSDLHIIKRTLKNQKGSKINKKKNFISRYEDDDYFIDNKPKYFITNKDGSYSTHSMAAEKTEDGRFLAFPTIVLEKNKESLTDLRPNNNEYPEKALKYALDNNEYLEFKSLNDAIKYTENYKKNTKLEKSINSFKDGGSFNVIPDGKLHAHKHNLSEIDDKFKDVTNKGMPVISYDEGGNVIQSAEIEKEEIIFNKEVTEELERLKKDGSEEAMIKAGKLLTKEIMENTIDYTNKLISDETTKD